MRTHRFMLLTTIMAMLAAIVPANIAAADSHLEVVFLEAAHGDTALYRGPCGEVGLIDANRGAVDEVLAQLDAWDARDDLAWISVSHYDADHLGDVLDVATSTGVAVDAVYDRGGDRDAHDTITYRDYYDWVTAAGIRQPVDIGDTFELCGNVEFDVVSAGTDGTAAGGVAVSAENDRSVCVAVAYGAFDLASCGDVNQDVETAAAPAIGDVEVVKVSHHGAAASSSASYVTTLAAEVAVFTVGSNSYGHPTAEVVDRWTASGAIRFQTGNSDGTTRDGDVTVTADNDGSFTTAGQTGRTFSTDGAPAEGTPDPIAIGPACDDAPRGRFVDDGTTSTHGHAIDCIGWWGVTQGVGDGRYNPSGDVTRDQMASFVARTIDLSGGNLPASPPDAFGDDNGNTHELKINQLSAAGVVGGTGGGNYSPSRPVTREQMASFLARAWEARTGTPLPVGADYFDDDGSTHEANINRVAAAGLTGGTAGGGYAPSATVSRAQMATFLSRLLAKLVTDGHTDYPHPEPEPDPEPGPGSMPDGTFANCTEARRLGMAPVYRGDPGYHSRLDGDGDGVGCE